MGKEVRTCSSLLSKAQLPPGVLWTGILLQDCVTVLEGALNLFTLPAVQL
jgi:hypothetical protein